MTKEVEKDVKRSNDAEESVSKITSISPKKVINGSSISPIPPALPSSTSFATPERINALKTDSNNSNNNSNSHSSPHTDGKNNAAVGVSGGSGGKQKHLDLTVDDKPYGNGNGTGVGSGAVVGAATGMSDVKNKTKEVVKEVEGKDDKSGFDAFDSDDVKGFSSANDGFGSLNGTGAGGSGGSDDVWASTASPVKSKNLKLDNIKSNHSGK